MNSELQTARLWLAPCKLEDLALVHSLWTNEQIKHFLFDDQAISLFEAREFVESSEQTFAAHGYGIWLIYLRKNNAEPIGFVGLLATEDARLAPRLLYGLHPDYWEYGFATEAADAVLNHAFAALNLPKIVSEVDAPNVASVRILEKLGMSQTKKVVVNDLPLLYFEITRAEFLSQKITAGAIEK